VPLRCPEVGQREVDERGIEAFGGSGIQRLLRAV
jgi:hypothetical protein